MIITFTRAYKNVSEYTILNECTVITHRKYSFTAEHLYVFILFSSYKITGQKKNIFNRITRESVQPIRALCVHESDARKPHVPTFGLSLLLTSVGSLRNLLLEIKSTFVFA